MLRMLSVFHQGAAAVAGAGVTQTICLPLLSVYEVSPNGTSQVNFFSPPTLHIKAWIDDGGHGAFMSS